MSKTYTPRQQNWKWFQDDGAEPTTQLANENVKPTLANDNIIRLRITLAELGDANGANDAWGLEYSLNDTDWNSFGPTAHWDYANGQATEGNTITGYKTTDANVLGLYYESGTFNNLLTKSTAEEFDFAIQPTGNHSQGQDYYFRVIEAGAAITLGSGETHPVVTTSSAAPDRNINITIELAYTSEDITSLIPEYLIDITTELAYTSEVITTAGTNYIDVFDPSIGTEDITTAGTNYIDVFDPSIGTESVTLSGLGGVTDLDIDIITEFAYTTESVTFDVNILIPDYVPDTIEDATYVHTFNSNSYGYPTLGSTQTTVDGWTLPELQQYAAVEDMGYVTEPVHSGKYAVYLVDDGGNNDSIWVNKYTYTGRTPTFVKWYRMYVYIPSGQSNIAASAFCTLFANNTGGAVGIESDASNNIYRWFVDGDSYYDHSYGDGASTGNDVPLDEWVLLEWRRYDESGQATTIDLYVNGATTPTATHTGAAGTQNSAVSYFGVGAGPGWLTGGDTSSFKVYFDDFKCRDDVDGGRIGPYVSDGIYDKVLVTEYDADILTNGNMELDSNWTDYNTPTYNERSTTQVHGGTYSRRIGGDSNQGARSDSITLVVGAKYLVEGWVYVVSGTFAMYPFGGINFSTHQESTTGQWIYFSEIATPTTTSGGLEMNVNGAGTEYYVDDVRVMRITNPKLEEISYVDTFDPAIVTESLPVDIPITIPYLVEESAGSFYIDFESGFEGWSFYRYGDPDFYGESYWLITKDEAYSGVHSLKIADDGRLNSGTYIGDSYTGSTVHWIRFYLYIPWPNDSTPIADGYATIFYNDAGITFGFEVNGSGVPDAWAACGGGLSDWGTTRTISTTNFSTNEWHLIELKITDTVSTNPDSGIDVYVDGDLVIEDTDWVHNDFIPGVVYLGIGCGNTFLGTGSDSFHVFIDQVKGNSSQVGPYIATNALYDPAIVTESITLDGLSDNRLIDVFDIGYTTESVTLDVPILILPPTTNDITGRTEYANAETGDIATESFDTYSGLVVSTDSKSHGIYGFKALYTGGGESMYGRWNAAPAITSNYYFRCYFYVSSDYTFQASTDYAMLEGVSSTWGGRFQFGFVTDGSGNPTSWRLNNAGSPSWANSSTNFSLDEWHYIEVYYNYGSSVRPDFYVDGVLCTYDTTPLGLTDETTSDVTYIFMGERGSRTGTNGSYIFFDDCIVDDAPIGPYPTGTPIYETVAVTESITLDGLSDNRLIDVFDNIYTDEVLYIQDFPAPTLFILTTTETGGLLNEDWEGSNPFSTWTETRHSDTNGVVYWWLDESGLQFGNKSAYQYNEAGFYYWAWWYKNFTAQDEVWVRFYMKGKSGLTFQSAGFDKPFFSLNASATPLVEISYRANGSTTVDQILVNGVNATPGGWTVGSNDCFEIRYKLGTGANAEIDVWINDTLEYNITNGSQTAQANRVQIGGGGENRLAADQWVSYDQIRVDTSRIYSFDGNAIVDTVVAGEEVYVNHLFNWNVFVPSIIESTDLGKADAETGDFSEWSSIDIADGHRAIVISDPSIAYRGNYCYASIPASGGQNLAFWKSFTGQTEVYARIYMKVDSGWTKTNTQALSFTIRDTTTTLGLMAFSLDGTANIDGIAYSGLGMTPGTYPTSLSKNTWYSFEIYWKRGVSDGIVTMWLNGAQIVNQTGLNNSAATDANNIIMGGTVGPDYTSNDITYFDNLRIATFQLGDYVDEALYETVAVTESITLDGLSDNRLIDVFDIGYTTESVTTDFYSYIDIYESVEADSRGINLIPRASSKFDTDGTSFWLVSGVTGVLSWNSSGYMEFTNRTAWDYITGWLTASNGCWEDCEIGKWYYISYDVKSPSGYTSTVGFTIGNGSIANDVTSPNVTTNWQTVTGVIYVEGHINSHIEVNGSGTGDLHFDNIFVKEISLGVEVPINADIYDEIFTTESVTLHEISYIDLYDSVVSSEYAPNLVPEASSTFDTDGTSYWVVYRGSLDWNNTDYCMDNTFSATGSFGFYKYNLSIGKRYKISFKARSTNYTGTILYQQPSGVYPTYTGEGGNNVTSSWKTFTAEFECIDYAASFFYNGGGTEGWIIQFDDIIINEVLYDVEIPLLGDIDLYDEAFTTEDITAIRVDVGVWNITITNEYVYTSEDITLFYQQWNVDIFDEVFTTESVVLQEIDYIDIFDEVFTTEDVTVVRIDVGFRSINIINEYIYTSEDITTHGIDYIDIFDEVFTTEDVTVIRVDLPTRLIDIFDLVYTTESIVTHSFNYIDIFDEVFTTEDVTSLIPEYFVNIITEYGYTTENVVAHEISYINIYDESFTTEDITFFFDLRLIDVFDAVQYIESLNIVRIDPGATIISIIEDVYASEDVTAVIPEYFVNIITEYGYTSESVVVHGISYIDIYDESFTTEDVTVFRVEVPNRLIDIFEAVSYTENITLKGISYIDIFTEVFTTEDVTAIRISVEFRLIDIIDLVYTSEDITINLPINIDIIGEFVYTSEDITIDVPVNINIVDDYIYTTESVDLILNRLIDVFDAVTYTESLNLVRIDPGATIISIVEDVKATEDVTTLIPEYLINIISEFVYATESITISRIGPPTNLIDVFDAVTYTEWWPIQLPLLEVDKFEQVYVIEDITRDLPIIISIDVEYSYTTEDVQLQQISYVDVFDDVFVTEYVEADAAFRISIFEIVYSSEEISYHLISSIDIFESIVANEYVKGVVPGGQEIFFNLYINNILLKSLELKPEDVTVSLNVNQFIYKDIELGS